MSSDECSQPQQSQIVSVTSSAAPDNDSDVPAAGQNQDKQLPAFESEQVAPDFRFEPEFEVLAILGSSLTNKRAFDVGANRGDYTAALRLAGFEVDSFEPLPELAEELGARFADDPAVRVHELACSDVDGFARLYEFSAADKELDTSLFSTLEPHPTYVGLHSDRHTLVETKRLDSVFPERSQLSVGLMKIDAEGHDIAVLEGAGEISAEAIFVEFWDEHFIFNQGRVRNRASDYREKIALSRFPHSVVFWRGSLPHEFGIIIDSLDVPEQSWGNILFLKQKSVLVALRDFFKLQYPSVSIVETG